MSTFRRIGAFCSAGNAVIAATYAVGAFVASEIRIGVVLAGVAVFWAAGAAALWKWRDG